MSLTQKIQRYLIQLNTDSHGSSADCRRSAKLPLTAVRKFMTKALPRIRAATHTGVRPWPEDDALARRWPNGDVGRCSCTSPNSPRRRSPTSSAWRAPSFPAICNRRTTYAAAGIPPILKWRALLRRLSGNGDRHPTRCMRVRRGTLHPGASPHFRSAIAPREGVRILERKEDLRPGGRWIRTPTEVVNSICNLTQFNANLRKCEQFHENLRKPTQITASSRTTEELPSPTRKPFCELDLHRRIRFFFLVPRGPQAGLGACRQAIDVKRRAHR